MRVCDSTVPRQIGHAAIAVEQRRMGHKPKSVTVVLSEATLVIRLHRTLSPAEKVLANSPAGAAHVQQLHKRLFTIASDSLRQEIKTLTGVEVLSLTEDVKLATCTVTQVFLLDRCVPAGTWSVAGPVDHL